MQPVIDQFGVRLEPGVDFHQFPSSGNKAENLILIAVSFRGSSAVHAPIVTAPMCHNTPC